MVIFMENSFGFDSIKGWSVIITVSYLNISVSRIGSYCDIDSLRYPGVFHFHHLQNVLHLILGKYSEEFYLKLDYTT